MYAIDEKNFLLYPILPRAKKGNSGPVNPTLCFCFFPLFIYSFSGVGTANVSSYTTRLFGKPFDKLRAFKSFRTEINITDFVLLQIGLQNVPKRLCIENGGKYDSIQPKSCNAHTCYVKPFFCLYYSQYFGTICFFFLLVQNKIVRT